MVLIIFLIVVMSVEIALIFFLWRRIERDMWHMSKYFFERDKKKYFKKK